MLEEAEIETSRPDNNGKGMAYAFAGIFCMAWMDALAKLLGEGYGVVQLVFCRNLFGLIVVLFLVWREGGRQTLKTRHPFLHLLRGLCALATTFCFFSGLQYMPLAEALAIAFAGPIFIAALSGPALKERVGPRRWAAVLAGFAAVLLILRPGSGAFQPASLLPLAAALGYAVVMITSRRLSREDSSSSILFWTAIVGLLGSLLPLPFGWITPTPVDWLLLIVMGSAGSVTMFLMVQAYRHAPAAVLAPFDYAVLIWGLIIGWLIWQELPDPAIWPGVALLIACGLYIIHREARAKARQQG